MAWDICDIVPNYNVEEQFLEWVVVEEAWRDFAGGGRKDRLEETFNGINMSRHESA